jgi:hypothetical protein
MDTAGIAKVWKAVQLSQCCATVCSASLADIVCQSYQNTVVLRGDADMLDAMQCGPPASTSAPGGGESALKPGKRRAECILAIYFSHFSNNRSWDFIWQAWPDLMRRPMLRRTNKAHVAT